VFQALAATALMAVSASCFLKYMWWAACYSAWNGIPKLAEQWRQAGTHASFYLWGFIILQVVIVATLCRLIKLRDSEISGFLKFAARLGLAFLIVLPATAGFALLLSWAQIGTR
jgi:hypothetical protein